MNINFSFTLAHVIRDFPDHATFREKDGNNGRQTLGFSLFDPLEQG